MKILYVEWWDSVSTQGWHSEHEDSDMSCTTIGYLISEDKRRLKIAQSISLHKPESFCNIIEIPKVAIRKWRVVKL